MDVDATVLRKGNIRIEGRPFPVAAVRATNDLIGLRNDAKYLAWMESTWPELVTRRQLRRWLSEGVPELLDRAAQQLRERGTLPFGELAALLETVERTGSDRISVPSLPSLAAWALSCSAESAAIVSICGECGLPWISRTAVDYCYRPAPGKTITCAQLHAHARFAELRGEWNREYRRIYARKLRGTVSEEDWNQWLTVANPLRKKQDIILPYDMWKNYMQSGFGHTEDEQTLVAETGRLLVSEWGKEEIKRIVTDLRAQIEAAGG
jgi:hypothetical protein